MWECKNVYIMFVPFFRNFSEKIIWGWMRMSTLWQDFFSKINNISLKLTTIIPWQCAFLFFSWSKYVNMSTKLQNWYKNPCRYYSVMLGREAVSYVRDAQQRTEEQPEHLLKSHTFMFYLRDFKRTFLKNICYFNVAVGLGKLWARFQIRKGDYYVNICKS